MKQATLLDIARSAQVSAATVSAYARGADGTRGLRVPCSCIVGRIHQAFIEHRYSFKIADRPSILGQNGRVLAVKPMWFSPRGFPARSFFTSQVGDHFTASEALSGLSLHAPGVAFSTRKAAMEDAKSNLKRVGLHGLTARMSLSIQQEMRASETKGGRTDAP